MTTQMVFSPGYLAEELTPYPLPTKEGRVLRTIGDVRAYMLALSKEREWRDHWKHAYRLLVRLPLPSRLTSRCPGMASLMLRRSNASHGFGIRAASWGLCA